jgi:signal transduction histidine kinase
LAAFLLVCSSLIALGGVFLHSGWAWFTLAAVISIGCYALVAWILRPFVSFQSLLEHVDIESDVQLPLSSLESKIPEFRSIARSLESLSSRINGHRSSHLKRLLVEKRRADLIAAAISDGVFLLRGDEVLYANPVGQRILMGTLGPSGESLFRAGLKLRDHQPGNGAAQAILDAVAKTMPIEFKVESEDRRFFYLFQAYPITSDVAEQVTPSPDRFESNMLVVAQDVTLVREGQDAKSHFLATLSHEVKTPVTSLTMAIRLLARGIEQMPNETHRSLITTCVSDIDRLRGLIEDLLTVSRFDTLTQKLVVKHVDFVKLVRHAVQSFKAQAAERGVELNAVQNEKLKAMAVPMDPSKITWALSNLLENAIRHTPKQGKVDVSVELVGDVVQVSVRDTGPGIDRKRQSTIFDKFSGRYELRVARTGGAGLGLAIAREIIVAHGGRIWVDSQAGQGSQFCFSLPIERAQPGLTASASSPVPASGPVLNPQAKGVPIGTSSGSG